MEYRKNIDYRIWNIEYNPEILDISYKHAWRTTVIVGGNSYVPRGLLWRSEHEDALNKSYTTCDHRLNTFQQPFPDNLCHPHLLLWDCPRDLPKAQHASHLQTRAWRGTPNYRFLLLGKMLVCFYSEVVETATSTSLHILCIYLIAPWQEIVTYLYIYLHKQTCAWPTHCFNPCFPLGSLVADICRGARLKANRPFSTTNFLLPIASKVYDWHGQWSLQKLVHSEAERAKLHQTPNVQKDWDDYSLLSIPALDFKMPTAWKIQVWSFGMWHEVTSKLKTDCSEIPNHQSEGYRVKSSLKGALLLVWIHMNSTIESFSLSPFTLSDFWFFQKVLGPPSTTVGATTGLWNHVIHDFFFAGSTALIPPTACPAKLFTSESFFERNDLDPFGSTWNWRINVVLFCYR